MKVYGVNLDGKYRGIVAATSQSKAAKLLGIPLSHLRTMGGPTGNKEEILVAMREPGVAWKAAQAYKLGATWERMSCT